VEDNPHKHTRIIWSINFSLQNNLALGGGCKNPKTGLKEGKLWPKKPS